MIKKIKEKRRKRQKIKYKYRLISRPTELHEENIKEEKKNFFFNITCNRIVSSRVTHCSFER